MFPCNAVDAKYAPACYHLHTSYILHKKGLHLLDTKKGSYMLNQNLLPLTESFKECDKIAPEEFVRYCYRGMGRQLSILVLNDMKNSLTLCQLGQSIYQGDCFRGMVISILDHRGIDQAFEFCKILPEQFKVDCYDGMGKWVLMLHSTADGRAKECSKAESSKYFEICMKADLEALRLL